MLTATLVSCLDCLAAEAQLNVAISRAVKHKRIVAGTSLLLDKEAADACLCRALQLERQDCEGR